MQGIETDRILRMIPEELLSDQAHREDGSKKCLLIQSETFCQFRDNRNMSKISLILEMETEELLKEKARGGGDAVNKIHEGWDSFHQRTA